TRRSSDLSLLRRQRVPSRRPGVPSWSPHRPVAERSARGSSRPAPTDSPTRADFLAPGRFLERAELRIAAHFLALRVLLPFRPPPLHRVLRRVLLRGRDHRGAL